MPSVLLSRPSLRAVAGIPLLALGLSSVVTAAPSPDRHVLRGAAVAIYDLAGELVVEPGTGTDVVVDVTIGGPDAAELRVEEGPVGQWQTLRVVFPGNRVVHGDGNWGSTIRVGEDGRFNDGGLVGHESGRRSMKISGSGSGIEAHADLKVLVPKGKRVAFFLGVGSATITNVEGELHVDLSSADATVSGTRGPLNVDSGSGTIRVSDVSGDVSLDSGSGSTTVRTVRGQRLSIDTGSGGLTLIDAQVDALNADTGSGSVEIQDLLAKDIALDSGSGSVRMSLLPGSAPTVEIDSGSGSVFIAVPNDLDASFDFETGSGGIDINVPCEVTISSNDRISGRFGKGTGHIHIDSGSGGIRIDPYTASGTKQKTTTKKTTRGKT